jgi:coenzyme PQQ synthesis protein D (PqqD)
MRVRKLMEAELGDELVALDPSVGTCFGFNDVATDVWRRLSSPSSFEQLRDGLLAQYEVSEERCTNELRELLDQLVAKGLVTTTQVDRNNLA